MNALVFLGPAWFAIVMGLCGLSLAWWRATPLFGEGAVGASVVIAAAAALVFIVLALASVWRAFAFPKALAEDLRHPVRHPFVAAVPVAVLLLATVAQALLGASPWIRGLWMVGAAGQFVATVWVLARWLVPGALAWPSITPVVFIPIVGNVLTPLAGVPLGLQDWAAAQFAVGLVFWPVVLTMLVVRIGMQGLWPERLLPATFISVAPAAVIGLSLLQMGAPQVVAWACWGVALFFLCWSLSVVPRLAGHPFNIAFWGLSFPLAAFASLTLTLATSAAPAYQWLAVAVLAAVSLVITGLVIGTLRGLRQGRLLVPESAPAPVTAVDPAPGMAR